MTDVGVCTYPSYAVCVIMHRQLVQVHQNPRWQEGPGPCAPPRRPHPNPHPRPNF
jgi:hypothetical protein